MKTVIGRIVSILLLLTLALSLPVAPAQSQAAITEADETVSLISQFSVDMEKSPPLAPEIESQRAANAADSRAVSLIVTFDESLDTSALLAASEGQIIHRYTKVFNGASIVLSEDKVDAVAALRGVTGIYLDELMELDTDVSPGFIGAPDLWADLGGQGSAGEGTVVAILDSGIWPEHPSFADDGSYPPPPNAIGVCDFGDTAWNPNDAPFTCNNKLIGAYDLANTYKAVIGLLPEEFDSARDADGHGTHTASTAAGNGGVAASIFGVPRGTISGVAPRAHVIAYKVCGDLGCFTSDSAAAVEQAILDEADALNFSISGGGDPYSDIVSLAFLSAYENGVFVAASAGNSGPSADTVAHREPWTTTVGASTTDRHFISTVALEADGGDTLTLEGASVTGGISSLTDVVLASDFGDGMCLNPFAPGTFSGQIVVCERGVIARVAKSFNVAAGGAGGMLLYNPVLQGLATDNHFIPSVHLENDAGADLLAFLGSHTGVQATFTQGVATAVQGDKMAAFSSRGGPGQTLGISKPDITAPGVQILAGHSPLPATVVGGLPGEFFQSIQGTSMSSPHIAGSAALLKDLHPDWSPGQIKSALMMTANTDHVKEDGVTPADPFDYGSGRVDLSRAGDPGLTISETAAEFVALEAELWNANYPSLYVPVMPGRIRVQRTVHSELSSFSLWRTSVDSPPDVKIFVSKFIGVRANANKTFSITVDARHVPLGEVRHATLELTNGDRQLHLPITIVRQQPAVTLEKTCEPASIPLGDATECTITMENTSFDDANVKLVDLLPFRLRLESGSTEGAREFFGRWIRFQGTLFGAAPPIVNAEVSPGATPFGYVPLSAFGGTIDIGATDESIANFGIPSFEYAGESYSEIGIVSNGYIVVGGGTGADVDFINSDLPDPALPNNTLAPFWTDLNPAFGGRVLINVLTDGANVWTVVEWESVRSYGDVETTTAQVWIGTNSDANPGEDISFVYGADVSDGDGGFLTVGAENKFGNSGGRVYFNGDGTPPAPWTDPGDYAVDVFSTPGEPGESHVITFRANGVASGSWKNCAELTGDVFFGTNIACFSGEVTP